MRKPHLPLLLAVALLATTACSAADDITGARSPEAVRSSMGGPGIGSGNFSGEEETGGTTASADPLTTCGTIEEGGTSTGGTECAGEGGTNFRGPTSGFGSGN